MQQLELAMGWIKDNPDIRDFTIPTLKNELKSKNKKDKSELENKSAKLDGMLHQMNLDDAKAEKSALSAAPKKMDLISYCSPIENQGSLGSCTANAAVGVLEYYEKRAFGKYIDGSRLFVYKTTRNLLGWTGDTGAYLRTTMGALALFGVPQEKYFPYQTTNFEQEPSSFIYALAQSYKAATYYRLDPLGATYANVLANIKTHLIAGLPSMFGFTCYASINDSYRTGHIPFPGSGENLAGGHAVVAIGYDDNLIIKNPQYNTQTKGALIIRNSWGTSWGDGGYGYLPYEYVLRGLATDFWVIVKNDWVDTGKFGI